MIFIWFWNRGNFSINLAIKFLEILSLKLFYLIYFFYHIKFPSQSRTIMYHLGARQSLESYRQSIFLRLGLLVCWLSLFKTNYYVFFESQELKPGDLNSIYWPMLVNKKSEEKVQEYPILHCLKCLFFSSTVQFSWSSKRQKLIWLCWLLWWRRRRWKR